MIPDTDKAYIAGLFDGEGSIHFKRGPEKKKKHKGKGYRISNSLRLSMEITMTCLLYTSPSPRDATLSRMPSSA